MARSIVQMARLIVQMARLIDSLPRRTALRRWYYLREMGLALDRDRYDEDDYRRFAERLQQNLAALEAVMARPGFGVGEATIGAELEVCLVDARGRPVPRNREILAASGDSRLALEIDRFNVEINTRPSPLAGRPFAFLAEEMESALAEIARAALPYGAGVATVGILPTLSAGDLGADALTDTHRYRALAAGLRRARGQSFRVRIEGEDPLEIDSDDIALEGANTSFQIHLRVAPEAFADTYNAAQIAAAPALAIAANAPTLLGHRLWDETRIALFRQAVDDRFEALPDDWRPARVSFGHGWVRAGAFELFAESVALHEPLLPACGDEDPLAHVRGGGVPALHELRAHHGTVWRWNRAVYDASGEGTCGSRCARSPPGPPSPTWPANAAFLLGLTLGLAPEARALLQRMTFGQARRNFYTAARHGVDAELLWPGAAPPSPRLVPAAELVERLLPVAERGLLAAGVDAGEIGRMLDVIARRAQRPRMTGAAWQRRALRILEERLSREEAITAMFARGTGSRPPRAGPSPRGRARAEAHR